MLQTFSIHHENTHKVQPVEDLMLSAVKLLHFLLSNKTIIMRHVKLFNDYGKYSHGVLLFTEY